MLSTTKNIFPKPPTSTRVYACFLPTNLAEQQIRKMFEQFGEIIIFKFSKRPDGFTYSYITYGTVEEAQRAIKNLNKKQIQDKILKVSFALPYPESNYKQIQISKERFRIENNQKTTKSETKKRKRRGKGKCADNVKFNFQQGLSDNAKYGVQCPKNILTISEMQEFKKWMEVKKKIQSKLQFKESLNEELSPNIIL